jgi:cytochrome P450 family 6
MWFNVLLAFVGLVTAAYFWMTRKYGWFKAQGIAEAPSYFPFGCKQNFQMLTGQLSFINSTEEIYRQHRHEKLVGYFVFSTPQLLINDLDLAKLILIKDFDAFIDRRQFPISEASYSEISRFLS